jgi:hypothetical protein
MTIPKYHHYRYITYGFVMLCRKYRVPTPKKMGKNSSSFSHFSLLKPPVPWCHHHMMAICSRKTTSPASPFCPAASAKKRVARLSVPMRPMMLMAPGNASLSGQKTRTSLGQARKDSVGKNNHVTW